MKPWHKRTIVYGSAVLALGAVVFIARQPIVEHASNVITFVKEFSDTHDDVLQTLRQEIFSQPLRANDANTVATLSQAEVVRLTNIEREKVGSVGLTRNVVLDQAATLKLQDMFDHQYFEHISPTGRGPGALADTVGYSYVVIGENLAMGNFASDQALIDAWMASPGHRENILNPRYMEIGVAVGRGMYEGKEVWIAVQEFGKPAASCPAIDSALLATIETDKAAVSTLSDKITDLKNELADMPHSTVEESQAYNAKVNEYNDAVSTYNTKVAHLKGEIDMYNNEVQDFNSCAAQ